jgi:glycosyltransferase involved in cell wall biosynthesis
MIVLTHNFPKHEKDPSGKFIADMLTLTGAEYQVVGERGFARGIFGLFGYMAKTYVKVIPTKGPILAFWMYPAGILAYLTGRRYWMVCVGIDIYMVERSGILRSIMKPVIAKADTLIFIGEKPKRTFDEVYKNQFVDKEHLCYLPVEQVFIEEGKRSAKSSTFTPPSKDGELRVVTVGSVTPRKRMDISVLAAKSLREQYSLAWTIVGKGSELDSIMAMKPAEVKIETFVRDLVPLYREADVFVLPSEDEGFGMVYLEAILCGCPVICRANDGGHEIVRRTGGGLAVELSGSAEEQAQTVATAIAEIRNNRPKYMNADVAARALAFADHDSIKQKWLEAMR